MSAKLSPIAIWWQILSGVSIHFNPFMPSGFLYLFPWAGPWIMEGVSGLIFYIFIYYRNSCPLCKQYRPF